MVKYGLIISLIFLLAMFTITGYAQEDGLAKSYGQNQVSLSKDDGCEYLIISGDVEGFKDVLTDLKNFRIEQGISTNLVTTEEIGGGTFNEIESYIDDAWTTWTVPPVAILLVGDHEQIEAPMYTAKGEKTDISDNYYADINKDDLPDLVVARLPFSEVDILSTYINKIINFEISPPDNPGYYNHPVTSMGWYDNSNNMICAEVTHGFFKNEMNKSPRRENAIALGTPGNDWTCSPGLISYFGPGGLGYVPATPEYLTWWGSNADSINENLNDGSFFITNLDNGTEYGWSYPEYWTSDLNGLFYSDPFFVVSINNLNGKFNWSFDCFAEAIVKHSNGAAGIIASSINLNSSVTAEYYLYLIDGLWDNFIPAYSNIYNPYPFTLPAFADFYSKYHLAFSSLQNKESIYYGLHYFGEPFVPVIYEVPDTLAVLHDDFYDPGTYSFQVTATEGSIIALTINNEIQSVVTGTGEPVNMDVNLPGCEDTLVVTVTKQNYIRYRQEVLCDYLGSQSGNILISFFISPNPASDVLKIDFEHPLNEEATVAIYDTFGKVVLTKKIRAHGLSSGTVDLKDIDQGVYFISVSSSDIVGSEKLLIYEKR